MLNRSTNHGALAVLEANPSPETGDDHPSEVVSPDSELPALMLDLAPFVLAAHRVGRAGHPADGEINLCGEGAWTLLVAEEGQMRIRENGWTWTLHPGQAWIWHPGRPSASVQIERARYLRLDFDLVSRPRTRVAGGWTPIAGSPSQPSPRKLWRRDLAPLLPNTLAVPTQMLAREICSTVNRSDDDHHRCNLLLAGWLARVFSEAVAGSVSQSLDASDPIAAAERAARLGFADGCTVLTMAKAAGLSASALERRWCDERGGGPGAYLRGLRYDHARHLLEQGVPVAEAAQKAGFRSRPSFARGFRRIMGMAPAEWRRRKRSLG